MKCITVGKKTAKKNRPLPEPVCAYSADYSSEIAPTGQAEAHEPQLTHFSASIVRFPSASEIASEGHSLSQAPQLIHSSEILYAINNLFDSMINKI